jgi:uncharacterized tellurite resistance protein B-like protein
MITHAQRIAFLRVLAAVAWADGAVDEDELNRIKVLFNSFGLDSADRKELESLLENPVGFAKGIELAKAFAEALPTPGSRKQLLAEIEKMAGAKESRSPEENELIEHLRAVLSSHTVLDGFVEKLRGVFSRTLFAQRPRRPGRLTEFARNSALQRVADLFAERGWRLDEDLPLWNRLTLLGVLLSEVAGVDDGWSASERRSIEKILAESLGLDEPSREVLLTIMEEERERDTDTREICAEYCRVSTMQERLEVLRDLFTVAAADRAVSKREEEFIHRIADFLWISHPEYFAVRDRFRDRIAS